MPSNEKRTTPRLTLKKPFCAQARIVQIDNKPISGVASIGKVCVLDISAGGMCFLSPLKLSASYENGQKVQIEVKIRISEAVTLNGQILWREQLPKYVRYGMRFDHKDIVEQNLLQTLINNATTVIKTDDKVAMILGYDFCDRTPGGCFVND